ncbi:MAG: type II toxin-antitoxin system VapC family toxin [Planctomycetes bacterium]|nr:type II toxin-antitoxin system VapC family toxin [Planctomycetota bacterium]
MRYLLDTCAFLWLCAEPGRLSRKARDALSDPAADLLLSDASVLEIALKWEAKKLALPAPPRAWVTEQAGIWRAAAAPITRAVIYRAAELPALHRDPFDRLLVSTALEGGTTIVTPDQAIHKYPVPWTW